MPVNDLSKPIHPPHTRPTTTLITLQTYFLPSRSFCCALSLRLHKVSSCSLMECEAGGIFQLLQEDVFIFILMTLAVWSRCNHLIYKHSEPDAVIHF